MTNADTIPLGWRSAKVGDVLLETQYGLNIPSSSDGNMPIVGMKDLVDGRVIQTGLARVSIAKSEANRYLLREGDILLNRTNSADLVGKVGYIDGSLHAVFASYLVRLKPNKSLIDPKFLTFWLSSSKGQEEIRPLITRGVSQANINPTAFCRRVAVPLPPLSEQRRIADILATWDRAIGHATQTKDHVEQLYVSSSVRKIHFRGHSMRPLGDLLSLDRMLVVEPDGPFRALGIRSHGKGTFHRIDDLAALGSTKIVYRIEPHRFVVNIVFAWEGAAAITSADDTGCLVSHRFPTFTINEKLLNRDYFRHMIRMKSFRQLLALASPGGAGRNRTLNRRDFLRFEIHVPPLDQQEPIAAALQAVDRHVELLDRYLSCLTVQRNALATELLTGRRRVPGAALTAAAN